MKIKKYRKNKGKNKRNKRYWKGGCPLDFVWKRRKDLNRKGRGFCFCFCFINIYIILYILYYIYYIVMYISSF